MSFVKTHNIQKFSPLLLFMVKLPHIKSSPHKPLLWYQYPVQNKPHKSILVDHFLSNQIQLGDLFCPLKVKKILYSRKFH